MRARLRGLAALGAMSLLTGTLGSWALSTVSASPMTHGRHTATAPASPSPTITKGDNAGVQVVGLGDSVTAGTACSCTSFVGLYASMLHDHSGRPVSSVNLGADGLTSSGLTDQLQSPPTRAALSQATLVVITIGANDLNGLIGRWQNGGCDATCIGDATSTMGRQLAVALGEVREDIPSSARVLVTTYWNVFEDGRVGAQDYGNAFHAWSDAVTRSANTEICQAANSAADTCVDLYEPFEGAGDRDATPLLADDGDHPNAAGHQLIAQALMQADALEPTS